MRILSGSAKGRVLQTPGGSNTRPTDSRSREILFNVLGERVVDARFLDCYAGSGAVGLEALSRGAAFCVFIEQEFAALRAIRANLKILGFTERAAVWAANVRPSLTKLEGQGEGFDLIFADPPFSLPREAGEFCRRMDGAPRLLDNVHDGIPDSGREEALKGELLIVQHSRRVALEPLQHFALARQKRAGESLLSFFQHKTPQGAALGDFLIKTNGDLRENETHDDEASG